MSLKQQISERLFATLKNKNISFNTAVKLYKLINIYLSRNRIASQKFLSRRIIGFMSKATSENSKRAWTSAFFPSELLSLFDIYPMTLEVLVGVFSTLGVSSEMLDYSDSLEVPNTMCSFHRALLALSEMDLVGSPHLIAATSLMCDGNIKSFSEVSSSRKIPMIFIDVPYESTKESFIYVRNQLKDAYMMLSDLTGNSVLKGSIYSVVDRINRSFQLSREVYNLRKESMVKEAGHEIANFAFPMHFLLGREVLIDILDRKRRDFARLPKPEVKDIKRLMWLHIVPQYDSEIWSVIDDGIVSKIVCDEYSSPYFEDYDRDDFLGSIARRLISHPSNGSIERRIEHILKIAYDYRVDGIIHFSSWGCHQASGNIQILESAIRDAGYKFINLSGDAADSRNASVEQHRTRLEAFLEEGNNG